MSKRFLKVLTNESFLGTFSLTILGTFALYNEMIEIAGICVGAIAAMLRGKEGQDDNS